MSLFQNETVKFTNCQLIKNDNVITDDLWVRDGKLINPEPVFYEERVQPDYVVNCNGALIVPGFIDIQMNGGFGYDFSSDNSLLGEALAVVRKRILPSGVTSFCPTIVTSPSEVYHQVIPRIQRCPGNKDGAEVLGIHLEGPFISPYKKGAHPINYITGFPKGMPTLLETYGNDLSNVALITLAPELPGACKVVKELIDKNIVVSLGHSNGSLADGEKAVNSGASLITHLFNAMLPFHHRDPGLVGLLTSQFIQRPVYYGIIADGIHTHPAALRIAYRSHPKGLVLVTDAMAALGLSDGRHRIGQLEVEVRSQRATLVGTDTLAGSICQMDECIQHFMKDAGTGIVEGVNAASLRPAKVLGISHRKGTLNYGADADLVFLNGAFSERINVTHTLIGGNVVYTSPLHPSLVFENFF